MSRFKLAILASGSGTNAEAICQYFQAHQSIEVSWIGSNKQEAFVLQRAKNLKIPHGNFTKSALHEPAFGESLQQRGITHVILAGFLLQIPPYLLGIFPDRIINIHPALLPAFGGKGMYGSRVHEAVIEAAEKESGITIHLVNENYDEGRILFQAKCEVSPSETVDTLAQKIHQLEHRYFPLIIEDYILNHHPA